MCGRETSLIHVLTHPRFGTSQPVLSESCEETACEMRCVQVCTADALRRAAESNWAKLLADPEWTPVPVLPRTEGV